MQLTPGSEGVRVPILMYHSVLDQAIAGNSTLVSLTKFDSDMRVLREHGYSPIFYRELEQYVYGRRSLPTKPIMIVFDDGYMDNFTHAYPIVLRHDMKMTVAVLGWSVGLSEVPWIPTFRPRFGFDEMREMLMSGRVDIQNHTFDLHSDTGLTQWDRVPTGKGVLPMKKESVYNYCERLARDLNHATDIFWRELGLLPRVIIYPFGAHTRESDNVARSASFTGSMTVRYGVRTYKTPMDLWGMPRINVTESLSGLKLIEAIEKAPTK